jgi:hypothetical protein
MPTLHEIQESIQDTKRLAQDDIRRRYVRELHEYTGNDVILYASAFASGKLPNVPAFLVSVTLEDVQLFMSALYGLSGTNLDLILHSPGGQMEAAEQIVEYLRAKYNKIRAIVPQNAMSAATMIACACDSIVMGKHSAIGPIDPQVTFPTPQGHFTAPAHAVLKEFERAKKEVADDPLTAPLWVNKIQGYPHGFIDMCEKAIDLSREKVTEWLDTYMFRDKHGEDNPSEAIAAWLADADAHKTHSRQISAGKAQAKGLVVEKLEDDDELQERVLSVFYATNVTFRFTNCVKFVENHEGRGLYRQVDVRQKEKPK